MARRSRLLTIGTPFRTLGVIALATMVFLSSQALQDPHTPVHVTGAPPQTEWGVDFPQRIERITNRIAELSLPVVLPEPRQEPQGAGALRWTHRRYELTLPKPTDLEQFTALFDPLRTAAPGVSLQVSDAPTGTQVTIGLDGLLTHTISFRWLTRASRVAIVIDSFGDDLLLGRDFALLEAPVALAIAPAGPFSSAIAQRAVVAGREVLVHLPLDTEPGKDLSAQPTPHSAPTRDDLFMLVDNSLAAVPQAVGMLGRIGSLAADRERMRWVLERLKQTNAFFIDSKAAPSTACDIARSLGVSCAARHIYIADESDESAVRNQLDDALELARTRGDIIVIGHAQRATLKALQEALPAFTAAGVDIVPLATLMADASLSRR